MTLRYRKLQLNALLLLNRLDIVSCFSSNANYSWYAESRREMLLRWKQQKELKRKQELMEQAKRKPFRVLHVVPELIPFKSSQPVVKPAIKVCVSITLSGYIIYIL
jgi:hypothetical protein